jgi:hypothetical protein
MNFTAHWGSPPDALWGNILWGYFPLAPIEEVNLSNNFNRSKKTSALFFSQVSEVLIATSLVSEEPINNTKILRKQTLKPMLPAEDFVTNMPLEDIGILSRILQKRFMKQVSITEETVSLPAEDPGVTSNKVLGRKQSSRVTLELEDFVTNMPLEDVGILSHILQKQFAKQINIAEETVSLPAEDPGVTSNKVLGRKQSSRITLELEDFVTNMPLEDVGILSRILQKHLISSLINPEEFITSLLLEDMTIVSRIIQKRSVPSIISIEEFVTSLLVEDIGVISGVIKKRLATQSVIPEEFVISGNPLILYDYLGRGGSWWPEEECRCIEIELGNTEYEEVVDFENFERKINRQNFQEEQLKVFSDKIETLGKVAQEKRRRRRMTSGLLRGSSILFKNVGIKVSIHIASLYFFLMDEYQSGLSPEQQAMFDAAVTHLQDSKLLIRLAGEFESKHFDKQAKLLKKRAALLNMPPEIKKKYQTVFVQALESNDYQFISRVAKAFEEQGAFFTAKRLYARMNQIKGLGK